MNETKRAGSALLLAVMIIAVLTTSTLGAIALRFDQLTSTDRINNSAVAKIAADSALIKLKEKLADAPNSEIAATSLDLENVTNGNIAESSFDPLTFQPNPSKIVSTYQKASTDLPRCLAVGVLIPWLNSSNQYLTILLVT